MNNKEHIFRYRQFDSEKELPDAFRSLLAAAKKAIENAYAPYSGFRVGAAALLENGIMVTGSNQENASSPVGICAERVTLSAVSAVYPGVAVKALAITARSKGNIVEEPVGPCGICRQSILEYEQRFGKNIELILQGESGTVLQISTVKELLPLHFNRDLLMR